MNSLWLSFHWNSIELKGEIILFGFILWLFYNTNNNLCSICKLNINEFPVELDFWMSFKMVQSAIIHIYIAHSTRTHISHAHIYRCLRISTAILTLDISSLLFCMLNNFLSILLHFHEPKMYYLLIFTAWFIEAPKLNKTIKMNGILSVWFGLVWFGLVCMLCMYVIELLINICIKYFRMRQ